ncbi:MAG: aminoacyl-tRNA hydrolase [Bacteroidales bacterium]|jgi:PTH1 family peptidyl-tRNA hydrolase|nr:aminoacyl-tRNA hydrolase [Bacteroidales bacterium]
MKYLIVGLGNIGQEYKDTRHNIGFMVLDYLAQQADMPFVTERYASTATIKVKGRTLVLIKPTTYMNLSGNAVSYWMMMERIPIENILVVVDDIALDLGVLRMRSAGSAGGHNGLAHISQILNTNSYARLRFGIGGNFSRGRQADYVLGKFKTDEEATVNLKIETAADMIKSFALIGADKTMNMYNGKDKNQQ